LAVALSRRDRRSKLLALRWSDVDLDAGHLTVNQALERVKMVPIREFGWQGETIVKIPKTVVREREAPAPALRLSGLCD
jgi:integrase